MDISFKTRAFYRDELRLLKALKDKKEKESGSKIKFHHFVIAGLLGSGCTYLATLVPDSFWTFLFGTLAVFLFSERIKPLTIDKKAKWNYMKKAGAPEHLQTEAKNFDKLIKEYNNCA